MILERVKSQYNHPFLPHYYFWRNTQQREVDFLEEANESLSAWEFKWNKNSTRKVPLAFINAYPHAKTALVTPKNDDDFLLQT